jgi:hypothetical protein
MLRGALGACAAAAALSAAIAAPAVAQGPPSPPPYIICQDLCHTDPDYPTSLKHWVTNVREWATSPPQTPRISECLECPPDPAFFVEDTKRFTREAGEWLLP